MIVGSGMFALPYAVGVSGVLWSSLIGALAFFSVLSLHIVYGEIVSNTDSSHRLPGYAAMYLGRWAGEVEKASQFLGFNTALAIYGSLGGIFLSMIFGVSPMICSIIFFGLGSAIFFFSSSEKIGFIDLILALPLMAIILYVAALSFSNGHFSNVPLFGRDPFFSFSIFIFSLTGLSAVADARDFLRGPDNVESASLLKSAITVATSIPLFLYIAFVIPVLMSLGSGVTKDALSGLAQILGHKIIILGGAIGFIATFTSYLALGNDLKKVYQLDIGISKSLSWLAVFLFPILIFIFSANNFVKLISLVGGFFISVDGLFVISILRKMRKNKLSKIHFLEFGGKYQFFLSAIFIASMIYEFVYQFF